MYSKRTAWKSKQLQITPDTFACIDTRNELRVAERCLPKPPVDHEGLYPVISSLPSSALYTRPFF